MQLSPRFSWQRPFASKPSSRAISFDFCTDSCWAGPVRVLQAQASPWPLFCAGMMSSVGCSLLNSAPAWTRPMEVLCSSVFIPIAGKLSWDVTGPGSLMQEDLPTPKLGEGAVCVGWVLTGSCVISCPRCLQRLILSSPGRRAGVTSYR